MAQFFQDDALCCPACGNKVLADRAIGFYSPSEEEGAVKFEAVSRQIYCPICGAKVKQIEKILQKR